MVLAHVHVLQAPDADTMEDVENVPHFRLSVPVVQFVASFSVR